MHMDQIIRDRKLRANPLAAAAGIITKALTKMIPITFKATATVKAIMMRKR